MAVKYELISDLRSGALPILQKLRPRGTKSSCRAGTRCTSGGEHEFEIDPSSGVEATELYPDVKYTTVDEYLNRLL